ncbi:hypothetical protein MNBD_GAMMA05-1640 [hydrothermal vent metagenome]|uniref:Inner membrane protein YgaP-like transmembrane domain-containing protein n=1 Tax=hydrothermal vent metagenome TaxID=652676 RepID=A0A3B0WDS3_9ZZZZ
MCNVNGLGQFLRVILGAILIALAWFGPQTSILSFNWINLWNLGWLGIFPLLSGIAAFCPIYAVFGFNHKQSNE